jgi:hypothetical protein
LDPIIINALYGPDTDSLTGSILIAGLDPGQFGTNREIQKAFFRIILSGGVPQGSTLVSTLFVPNSPVFWFLCDQVVNFVVYLKNIISQEC